MATDHDIASTQYQNYRFCYDNGHAEWLATARRCFEFWQGKQWDPYDKAKLLREGRPALTFNVLGSLVRSMKGIQRALRNDVRYVPVHGANSDDARVRDALWLYEQQQNMLDFLETDVYESGLIMARAYYDARVEYDHSFRGHVKIRKRRSQDVILDPSVDEYETDSWPQVYTRRWVSQNDIERLYGKEKAEAVGGSAIPTWFDYEDAFMAQQMGNLPYYQGGCDQDVRLTRARLLLERQYRTVKMKEVFVDMQTGDVSEIPENWERNRIANVLAMTPGLGTMKRQMDTVRWTVTCEGVVLHDEDSPYKWFTIVPFFPDFVDGVSKGIVESLLDPQMLFNKVSSSELHIISTTANSGYKVKRGALQNMTPEELEQNGARAGFVAELDDIANLEKITPNSTPQGHDRLSFKADQIMRSLSGVPDGGRGFARDDASGTKVMQDQAAQEINFAGPLGNLHRSKQMLARVVADCHSAFYTETRTIMISQGSVFNPKIKEVTINQPSAEGKVLNDITSGKYITALVPSPARTTMDSDDFELLVKLRTEVGIAIPDALLLEVCPASNRAQLIQSLETDSNERQKAAEQAEEELRQAELAKTQATARKEDANALLAQTRAEKFAVEAATDPDASYERVEMERIAAERESSDKNLALEHKKAEDLRQFQDNQIAVRLEEIDQRREAAKNQNNDKGPKK